jgi:glycerol uptake facilitator protein
MVERFLAELIGTMILIILGDGVVAGVLLNRSKAQNAGWIVITAGWAFAVMVAVYVVGPISGAHINPAVTLALVVNGSIAIGDAIFYWAGQFLGAFIGAVIVWLHYLPHWAVTEDAGLKLAVFSTGPAIRNTATNLISEIIGTAVLVVGVLGIGHNFTGDLGRPLAGALAPLLVAFLVFGIGLSLGGPTGYAINPARDLGPRVAHAVLPIPGKGTSDWEYAWIPVVGPLIGGVLGVLVYQLLFANFMMRAAGA